MAVTFETCTMLPYVRLGSVRVFVGRVCSQEVGRQPTSVNWVERNEEANTNAPVPPYLHPPHTTNLLFEQLISNPILHEIVMYTVL